MAGVLASHYVEAYRATSPGPEADALAAQARIALRAAAERSAALHSHVSAVHYLEEALTVTDDPAEQAALHERAAHSAYAYNVDAAVDHAKQAMALFEQESDAEGALRSTAFAAQALLSLGRGTEARAALEEILKTAPEDAPDWAAAMGQLARAHMLSQRNDEAVALSDRAWRQLAPAGCRSSPPTSWPHGARRSFSGRTRPRRSCSAPWPSRNARATCQPSCGRGTTCSQFRPATSRLNEAAPFLAETADVARRGGDAPFPAQMLLQLRLITTIEAGTWSATEAPLEELAAMELDSWRTAWYARHHGLIRRVPGRSRRGGAALATINAGVAEVDTFWAENVVSAIAGSASRLGDLQMAADIAMPVAGARRRITPGPDAANAIGGRRSSPAGGRCCPRPSTWTPRPRRAGGRAQIDALVAVAEGGGTGPAPPSRGAPGALTPLDLAILEGHWPGCSSTPISARVPDARQAGVDAEAPCLPTAPRASSSVTAPHPGHARAAADAPPRLATRATAEVQVVYERRPAAPKRGRVKFCAEIAAPARSAAPRPRHHQRTKSAPSSAWSAGPGGGDRSGGCCGPDATASVRAGRGRERRSYLSCSPTWWVDQPGG